MKYFYLILLMALMSCSRQHGHQAELTIIATGHRATTFIDTSLIYAKCDTICIYKEVRDGDNEDNGEPWQFVIDKPFESSQHGTDVADNDYTAITHIAVIDSIHNDIVWMP